MSEAESEILTLEEVAAYLRAASGTPDMFGDGGEEA